MLRCPPEIVSDDLAAPASKRRRLNEPDAASVATESACLPLKHEISVPVPTSTTGEEEDCGNILVCYGMISDLKVNIPSLNVAAPPRSNELHIRFEPPRTLHCSDPETSTGQVQLDDFEGELLTRLVADDELILQLSLSSTPIAPSTDRRLTKIVSRSSRFLGVIIYGPRSRSGDLGEFITKAGCYLDDPINCDRNVPYLNPQCLFSLHERWPMTFELSPPHQPCIGDFTRISIDVLSDFETTAEFELSATPTALRTVLKPHQRQALTFCLRRERGMHPHLDGYGLWLRHTSHGQSLFTNAMTDETRANPSPLWRGGLLADEMGLGKTLSMIALITSDQDYSSGDSQFMTRPIPEGYISSTLIVVPLSLINVWELQLKRHVRDGKVTWLTHHGRQRFRLKNDEAPPDIVFTTYQTIEREHRHTSQHRGSLFAHHWRRIILDEAHMIRNHKTSTAQATAALRAVSRWALSGTPIQNSLLDFYGLFKFLHFSPYDDLQTFDEDITDVWRAKPADEAAATFKRLLSCIMMRRTKAILDLPCRDDRLVRVPFSLKEHDHYRRIEQPVVAMLDCTGSNGSHASVPWMTAIQQINKLRLACNLGTFIPSPSNLAQTMSTDDCTSVMSTRYLMGGELCVQCFQQVEASTRECGLLGATQTQVYYSACKNFYCTDCAALLQYRSPDPCACMGPRPCQLSPLTPTLITPRLSPIDGLSPSPMGLDQSIDISSKVWALASQIRSRPEAKHVVFSSWTSSLDMVQRALLYDPQNVIQSVRIDGKVKPKGRNQAIQRLDEDPSVRVILITIACGACGLDLTAASVVHLLEPQWNPSTEDQALARVHRLGQTRAVTTIRYVMEDSFEEHILKVQDRKKLLATTLLSNGSSLENLRQLLHEGKGDQHSS